jgi:peptidoglycan/xylan/chitin deacetylase (PgdA/CDA1 family)
MHELISLIRSTTTWVAFLTFMLAGMVALVIYGIRGRSSQLFGSSVYCGPGQRKSIALTFDDGPSEGTTELLEYLGEQGVSATFFQCGMNVLRHPDIAKAVHAAGHEIGNHTFSHLRLCPRLGWKLNLQSVRSIYREFYETQRVIQRTADVVPVFLRAPYGLRWLGLRVTQRRLGLIGVMWTVIGHDWEWKASEITEYILERSHAGGIICLHDGRDIQREPNISQTLLAVRMIVPELKKRGFLFETVSGLLQADPVADDLR